MNIRALIVTLFISLFVLLYCLFYLIATEQRIDLSELYEQFQQSDFENGSESNSKKISAKKKYHSYNSPIAIYLLEINPDEERINIPMLCSLESASRVNPDQAVKKLCYFSLVC